MKSVVGIGLIAVLSFFIIIFLIRMIKDKNAVVRVIGYLIILSLLVMVLNNIVLQYFFNVKLFQNEKCNMFKYFLIWYLLVAFFIYLLGNNMKL